MALDLDQFTDKAQATVQAAIQLAKDYANSQSESTSTLVILRINSDRSSIPFFARAQYTPHILVLCS